MYIQILGFSIDLLPHFPCERLSVWFGKGDVDMKIGLFLFIRTVVGNRSRIPLGWIFVDLTEYRFEVDDFILEIFCLKISKHTKIHRQTNALWHSIKHLCIGWSVWSVCACVCLCLCMCVCVCVRVCVSGCVRLQRTKAREWKSRSDSKRKRIGQYSSYETHFVDKKLDFAHVLLWYS